MGVGGVSGSEGMSSPAVRSSPQTLRWCKASPHPSRFLTGRLLLEDAQEDQEAHEAAQVVGLQRER